MPGHVSSRLYLLLDALENFPTHLEVNTTDRKHTLSLSLSISLSLSHTHTHTHTHYIYIYIYVFSICPGSRSEMCAQNTLDNENGKIRHQAPTLGSRSRVQYFTTRPGGPYNAQ